MVANVLYTLALAKKLPTMRVSLVQALGIIAEHLVCVSTRFLVSDLTHDF